MSFQYGWNDYFSANQWKLNLGRLSIKKCNESPTSFWIMMFICASEASLPMWLSRASVTSYVPEGMHRLNWMQSTVQLTLCLFYFLSGTKHSPSLQLSWTTCKGETTCTNQNTIIQHVCVSEFNNYVFFRTFLNFLILFPSICWFRCKIVTFQWWLSLSMFEFSVSQN